MMDAFASRTGTKRNLAALREAGWGLFVAAAGVHRHEGFRFWAENSAYTWWQRGLPFQVEPWQRLLDSHGRDPLCEGIVAPDIVCGGAESLRLTLSWLPRLLDYGPRVYLPVQPGIVPRDVAPLLGDRVGLFVGGGDVWKETTCATWANLAQLGLVLVLEAWVLYEEGGRGMFMEFELEAGDGLDVALLLAWNNGARNVTEVQIAEQEGAYVARGAGFVFVSWGEVGD